MKIVYLVRHSENIKKGKLKFISNFDEQELNERLPLSISGETKAYNMVKKFFDGNIDQIWSSSYERAISTAKYIAEFNDLNINVSVLFNERKLGIDKNVQDEFWLTQLYDENAKIVEGESRKEVTCRMLEGLNNILDNVKDNCNVVIVSHAAAITFLLMNWCELRDASLVGKKRWLIFKEQTVINDSFETPDVFKLTFVENELISVKRVNWKEG